ncbi:hypothetical protein HMPREF3203_02585 [Proteus mirabilis]|nr:hypothetical protein HMPREF3203_02585 [Proteus mirabilis]
MEITFYQLHYSALTELKSEIAIQLSLTPLSANQDRYRKWA